MFERAWERGRPFTNRERTMMAEIAAEQRAMTIRMLIEGHSDPVSAKRLGVSPRTYAGYVADLKAEYESETRFQLGYTMGRQGISGTENTDRLNPRRRCKTESRAMSGLDPDTALDHVETSPGGRCGTAQLQRASRGLNRSGCAYRRAVRNSSGAPARVGVSGRRRNCDQTHAHDGGRQRDAHLAQVRSSSVCPLISQVRRVHGMTLEP